MDPRTAASQAPDPDAVDFVRFCYHRRRVGWPELYDEMCAVAARGLYRGYGPDDLAGIGIGFGLFDTPALAALATRIVDEERASRRPVTVVLTDAIGTDVPAAVLAAAVDADAPEILATQADVEAHSAVTPPAPTPDPVVIRPEPAPSRPEPALRFRPVTATA
jgi:hypothetical protein